MLARFWLTDTQLRMLTAPPMDRQDDLARGFVNVGNDIGDEGTQELLVCAHAHAWRVPCRFEVIGQPGKVRHDGGWIRRQHRLQSRLARLHAA
jgi:hypothetical protein